MRLRVLMPGSRFSEMALQQPAANYEADEEEEGEEEDDEDEDEEDDEPEVDERPTTKNLTTETSVEESDRDRPATVRVEDDELTSLTWLQNKNLLQGCIGNGVAGVGSAGVGVVVNNRQGAMAASSSVNGVTPFGSANVHKHQHAGQLVIDEQQQQQQQTHQQQHYNPTVHVCSKPPYSFSCLIFMAIEDSPSRALPVKDIYSWILAHFPYFQNAPTGWKNSVRHNLSLNKCFLKVDKGQNIAKGSLWCVDPEHRPNLLQALRKTPFKPCIRLPSDSPAAVNVAAVPTVDHFGSCAPVLMTSNNGSTNLLNPALFPYLSKRLTTTLSTEDMEVDAAATMLSLKNGPRLLLERPSVTNGVDNRNRRRQENGGGGGGGAKAPMTSLNPVRERRHRRLQDKLGMFKKTEHRNSVTPAARSVIVGPGATTTAMMVTTMSPNDDHTYSSSSTNSPVRPTNSGDSPSSSIDEPFEFGIVNGCDRGKLYPSPPSTGLDGDSGGDSGVTRSDSEDEEEEDQGYRRRSDPSEPKSVRCPVIVRTMTTATGHCRVVVENEEQMKIVEGADALLNLAGFSNRDDREVSTVAVAVPAANRIRRKRKPSRHHLRRVLPAQEAHR